MTINRTIFFAEIRRALYRDALPRRAVEGFEALLAAAPPDWRDDWLAYALATVYHETAYTMQPVREIGRGKGRKYGERDPETGQVYYGRGYPQLTWKRNYADWAKRTGLDLVNNPDLALRPDVSARILFEGMALGTFTGKSLRTYTRGGRLNFKDARRIINGTDRDDLIAGYARVILAALLKARAAEAETKPAPEDVADAAPTGKSAAASTTVWAQGAAIVSTLGTAAAQAFGAIDWKVAAVLSVALVAAFAIWTISERLRHAREDGV